ncbi:hypothetical protein PGT21_035691 [Puccinia graminis f. sp. tritici]|uniref:Uncharacterized protein n=1 Tax=Puccinia graminis f. sp. tritici TaxID=56615 RepID=A0A5B0PNB1_PUCGR|nr:hypothetical protein PGT21_035691 [Puccinia graminis f. sp. tritici]
MNLFCHPGSGAGPRWWSGWKFEPNEVGAPLAASVPHLLLQTTATPHPGSDARAPQSFYQKKKQEVDPERWNAAIIFQGVDTDYPAPRSNHQALFAPLKSTGHSNLSGCVNHRHHLSPHHVYDLALSSGVDIIDFRDCLDLQEIDQSVLRKRSNPGSLRHPIEFHKPREGDTPIRCT